MQTLVLLEMGKDGSMRRPRSHHIWGLLKLWRSVWKRIKVIRPNANLKLRLSNLLLHLLQLLNHLPLEFSGGVLSLMSDPRFGGNLCFKQNNNVVALSARMWFLSFLSASDLKSFITCQDLECVIPDFLFHVYMDASTLSASSSASCSEFIFSMSRSSSGENTSALLMYLYIASPRHDFPVWNSTVSY